MEEFALGKCAMVQNGNWAWGQISSVEGNVVKEEDVKFFPIYTGVQGEENQGICIGTENFICINKLATEEQQKASIAFIEWVYSSEIGKDYVTNKLGFISLFNTFTEEKVQRIHWQRSIALCVRQQTPLLELYRIPKSEV